LPARSGLARSGLAGQGGDERISGLPGLGLDRWDRRIEPSLISGTLTFEMAASAAATSASP